MDGVKEEVVEADDVVAETVSASGTSVVKFAGAEGEEEQPLNDDLFAVSSGDESGHDAALNDMEAENREPAPEQQPPRFRRLRRARPVSDADECVESDAVGQKSGIEGVERAAEKGEREEAETLDDKTQAFWEFRDSPFLLEIR